MCPAHLVLVAVVAMASCAEAEVAAANNENVCQAIADRSLNPHP